MVIKFFAGRPGCRASPFRTDFPGWGFAEHISEYIFLPREPRRHIGRSLVYAVSGFCCAKGAFRSLITCRMGRCPRNPTNTMEAEV